MAGVKLANDGKFGLHYFDKPGQESDEQEEDEVESTFDLQTCENDCCDLDCECDDCLRCSTNNMRSDDDSPFFGAAAA